MSLEFMLSPAAVAVVGVGRGAGGVGRGVFDSLHAGGFEGDIWPINPRAEDIAGYPCYPSIAALPSVPDLVVVAVPGGAVPGVMEECGAAGVRGVIVLSAGFKETGAEGAALETRIAEIAQTYGIRLLGPNCLGIMMPTHRLNASFGGEMVPAGSIGVVTQSGALGTAILDWARSGRGLSAFISLGNRADLSEADFIEAIAADGTTRVIAGYLESIMHGPRFVEVASEVSRNLPIVLLKAGASEAGARAVSSHTGSLAGSDAAYDAAFDAAGVIRARDTEELFGISETLAHQPIPKAPGLAIITNAGGPAVMATDACERTGVKLAQLEPSTVEALRAVLPPASAFYNPVDILGDAEDDRYEQALQIVAADPNVHSVLVLLTPQAPTRPMESAAAIIRASESCDITVLACFMGEDRVEPARRELARAGVPAFRYPERAVEALAAVERYRDVIARPVSTPPTLDVDRDAAARIIDAAREAHEAFITEQSASDIARAYGITTPRGAVARDRNEALSVAHEVGYPVVIKIASPDILHKSDMGGIVLNIQDDAALIDAWDTVMERARRRMPDAAIWGALVQEMAAPGYEVIVGVNRDPTFGPLVMFGLGGVLVEILRDVAFGLAPLDAETARRMIASTRASALLHGVRGAAPADVDAIVDVLVRVSALVRDFPEIQELDINPLVVARGGTGAVAADIRIGIGG